MNRTIGGILLVTGTTIGAGMLALPVVTGFSGFFPSAFLFILFWLFMTYTALLTLEVNLWMGEKSSNMISMADRTLGKFGKAISWGAYLFLLYALTTAYLAGSGPIVAEFVNGLTGIQIPNWMGGLPLLLIFGYFIYQGTRSVDYLNRILMIGLAIAYLMMVILAFPHVEKSLLSNSNWGGLLMGASVVATSFGFHIIIPSLTTYLNRDVKKLRQVIIIGSTIPLLIYLIWEFIVLGIIPPSNLARGFEVGANGAHLLSEKLSHSTLALIARFFSFFAIVTSFLGVSLSLADFLADGFKIDKDGAGKARICFLTFGPPIIFAWIDPRAFLSALDYAGTFGVVLLLGLMPALMVLKGRKKFGAHALYRAPGGTLALIVAIALSCLMIGVEIAHKLNWI